MKRFVAVFFVLAFTVSIFAQDVPQATSPLVLQDGTPVQLRLSRTVSSADAQLGDTISTVDASYFRFARENARPNPLFRSTLLTKGAPPKKH